MNDSLSEKKERELSERYDRGDRSPRDDMEASVFEFYRQTREYLKEHSAPALNVPSLSKRLADEMGTISQERESFLSFFTWIPKFVWAGAAIVILLVSAIGIGSWWISTAPMMEEDGTQWIHRLQSGKTVFIPGETGEKREAVKLADGSMLTCYSQSTVRVRINNSKREIHLDYGKINVNAAHIEDSTMIVYTPLVDIHVVGTTFNVEVY